jgi:hypothetical protein
MAKDKSEKKRKETEAEAEDVDMGDASADVRLGITRKSSKCLFSVTTDFQEAKEG